MRVYMRVSTRARRHPPAGATARHGLALPTAIFAIVVIGALLAGAYFASSQERVIGRNTLIEQRAFNVAEYGLNFDVSNWDQARNIEGSFPVGSADINPRYVNQIGDTANVTVTRLSPTNFLVVSTGRANIPNPNTESIRRTSMMVQIAYPSVKLAGAVVSAGTVQVGGSGAVIGFDHDPAGWGQECDAYDTSNLSAIAVASPNNLQLQHSTDSSHSEPTQNNPAGIFASADSGALRVTQIATDPNTYIAYGSETWTTLQSNADVKIPSAWSGRPGPAVAAVNGTTVCNRSLVTNWGQPDHVDSPTSPNQFKPCISYYPIIFVNGDLDISGGKGQGILLVNGSLTMNGGFEFDGLIIVKNDLRRGNGTATIRGGIMVANGVIDCAGNSGSGSGGSCTDGVNATGTFTVAFSKCAVENALRASAILVPVKQRAWAQMY
ncbi:MAG: hypothetical protein ACJ79S_15175 [Gemmatimonadaceae bacterium]